MFRASSSFGSFSYGKMGQFFSIALFYLAFALLGCSKEEVAENRFSELAIVNVSGAQNAVGFQWLNQSPLMQDLSVGTLSSGTEGPYLALPAGLGEAVLQSAGGDDLFRPRFFLQENRRFSLWVFDTLKNNLPDGPFFQLIQEGNRFQPSASDTSFYLRFVQTSLSLDPLGVRLIKGTDTLPLVNPADFDVPSTTGLPGNLNFLRNLNDGLWRVEVYLTNGQVVKTFPEKNLAEKTQNTLVLWGRVTDQNWNNLQIIWF